MTVKRYLVKDMNEAMTRIRYELGSGAIIISSRWIRQKGLRNLFSRKVLEVTAAAERKQDWETPALDQKETQLENEIKELKEMVGSLMKKEKTRKNTGKKVQFGKKMQNHLKNMDLDEQIIKDFTVYCREEGNSNVDYKEASQYFSDLLETSILKEQAKENTWVFLGPTGVGKTTTIAKIAARETLENRKRVGLVTMDTYRIGAVEQLKTYADILNIPLEVAATRTEMTAALEKLKDRELILIDSTGRNSKMKDQLLEVKDCLSVIKEKHNILVMSGTTRSTDLRLILENYKEIGYDSIILTKLDETQCYGSILNVNRYTDKPLCYITTGQVVPEDIRKATKETVLKYVMMGVDG